MIDKQKIARAVQLALLLGAGSYSMAALAADDAQDEAKKKDEKKVERIEVTGSRIKRTDIEGVANITVITAKDMLDKGQQTVFDALKDLSTNIGTTQGEEFGSQGGFTPDAQTISLRDFGPGYVLVLVNGRRVAENPTPYNGQSNFVNLANFPSAAVERIEILNSGASAIYGSDAVTGVINIILKKDVDYSQINARFGTTRDGGGDTRRLQFVTGTAGSKYHLTFAAQYFDQDIITGKDRSWLNSVDDGPAGVNYLTRGILRMDYFTGQYIDPGAAACQNSGTGYEYTERPGKGMYCGYDGVGEYSLQNRRKQYSAFLTGHYDFSDTLTGFADVMYVGSKNYNEGFRHFISEYVFNPQTANYELWQRLFTPEELAPKKANFTTDAVNVTMGLKGQIGGAYDWEAYFTDSEIKFKTRRDWLKEEKVSEYFLGDYLPDYGVYYPVNPKLGLYDPITDAERNDMLGVYKQDSKSYSRTFNASISGDLFELPAGPLQFSAMAEFNRQGYNITLDDRTLNETGQGWYGLTGTEGGGDRNRYAVGVELLVPVIDGLDFNIASRYDKYDDNSTDIGGRLSSQFGFTYSVMKSLKFRGSVGQSFRAPDMHYVFADRSGFYTSAYDYTSCGTLDQNQCDSVSIRGWRSGSKDLKEETGLNKTIGLVWEPIDNLSMTVDYTRLRLEDIVLDESVDGLLETEYRCNTGDKDPNSGECQRVYSKVERFTDGDLAGSIKAVNITPFNNSVLEWSGWDVNLRYNYATEKYGSFRFDSNWTLTSTYKYKALETDELVDYRNDASYTSPRSKLNASLGWDYNDVSLTLYYKRVGGVPYRSQVNTDGEPYSDGVARTSAWTTYNFTAGYSIDKNNAIYLNIVNLTNEKPPYDPTETSWPFYNIFAYPGAAIGTYWAVEYQLRF